MVCIELMASYTRVVTYKENVLRLNVMVVVVKMMVMLAFLCRCLIGDTESLLHHVPVSVVCRLLSTTKRHEIAFVELGSNSVYAFVFVKLKVAPKLRIRFHEVKYFWMHVGDI